VTAQPPAAGQADAVGRVLACAAAMLAATDVPGVLRHAAECAAAATASPAARAGLFDGEAATSHDLYSVQGGWTAERRRWPRGQDLVGRCCAGADALSIPADGDEPAQACAPLLAADAVVGFVQAAGLPGGYDDATLARLHGVAQLAAQRLQDVAAAERTLVESQRQGDIAQRLQRQLVPQQPPTLPGLDIAFAYRSASHGVLSGGDFMDYYRRPPSDGLAFCIGDVSGKGLEAMSHTLVAKFILRGAVHGGQVSWPIYPGAALQELRTGLLEQPDFASDSERFVTVLFGLIDPRRKLLQLSSAGHPTPLLVRRSLVERPLLLTQPAIGVELGAALEPYPTETIELDDDDLVVMFTDGIAELRDTDGSFFEDRMAAALDGCHGRPAADVVAHLLAAAEAFSARPPADDMALMCIRLRRSL
jgi:serine phosphatase RsbU (regulator of sigma subunit)